MFKDLSRKILTIIGYIVGSILFLTGLLFSIFLFIGNNSWILPLVLSYIIAGLLITPYSYHNLVIKIIKLEIWQRIVLGLGVLFAGILLVGIIGISTSSNTNSVNQITPIEENTIDSNNINSELEQTDVVTKIVLSPKEVVKNYLELENYGNFN